MQHYDVIVIGGGPAGVAAAISSARLGQKTLIIENGNALGGAINHMLVLPIMEYSTSLLHFYLPLTLWAREYGIRRKGGQPNSRKMTD